MRNSQTHSNKLLSLAFSGLSVKSLVALFTLSLAFGSSAQPISWVGEVSLVLGEVTRLAQDGNVEVLKQGSRVAEGDRIVTKSNGHVHVRFVDEALVSVRPSSQLIIDRYYYDAELPHRSSVRFELQEGVTRAISGEAAKAARDRFRLNTPIAAIGVRGTDFVVSADRGTTRALVNEGSIVMAPLSDACSADSFGPCVADALELNDASLQLATMQLNEPLPRLLPSQNVRDPGMLQKEVRLAIAGAAARVPAASELGFPASSSTNDDDQYVNNEVFLEGVTTVQVRADAELVAETVATKDFVPSDPVAVTLSAGVAVAQFDLTPPVLLTSSEMRDRQLVWGRYADVPLVTERLALSFEEASASREITVGNFQYGLYRSSPGPRRVASDLGLVGFQLTSAQAVFNSETGVLAMSVHDGSLNIDFQQNTFNTMLELSAEPIGQIFFAAEGKVADGGFLRALEATQRVAGAVSFDGTEAGYLFEKSIIGGSLSGLTLWGSQ